MVALRSRRLELVFGESLESLAGPNIERLVTSQIREDYDLDFKGPLYGNSDSQRRELASDVAALANTAGGVLLLGVEEDDQATATAAPGVSLSDSEKTRMEQIIASGVAPVPVFDILPIPREDNGSRIAGFYVIAVARSLKGPHAVAVNEGFRYPVRNGTSTRYLSEPEIAAAYRDRFAARVDLARRLDEVEEASRRQAVGDTTAWLLVTLVPDMPGHFDISTPAIRAYQAWLNALPRGPYSGGFFSQVIPGRRRLIADDGARDRPATDIRAELHTDGAGTVAVRLGLIREPPEVPLIVSDEDLALRTLDGLLCLAGHARDQAHAGGIAALRARIYNPLGNPIEIGSRGRFSPSSISLNAMSPGMYAETSAPIDELAEPGPDLVATTARLLDELGHDFGIPEAAQFNRDGTVLRGGWSRRDFDVQRIVVDWASVHGIDCV